MADQLAVAPGIEGGRALASRIARELHKRIVGQEEMIERLLIGLLAGGHVLLEGVPGLAKTLTVRTLAEAIHASFERIQFTPDLLPADVVGTMIYNQRSGEFSARRGPIFANIVLADEINRAPPKVQSALLEAMQEHQVTLGGETLKLPEPFLVLATQNPIEQEGTYPLPEAQVDRFMLKLRVGYPPREMEKEIMRRMSGRDPVPLQPVATLDELFAARSAIVEIYMDDKIADYIVDLVQATRVPAQYGLASTTVGSMVPLDTTQRSGRSRGASIRYVERTTGRVPRNTQSSMWSRDLNWRRQETETVEPTAAPGKRMRTSLTSRATASLSNGCSMTLAGSRSTSERSGRTSFPRTSLTSV